MHQTTLRDKYININPFTDFGFKKLFGSKPNKDLLIDFLNQVIKEQGRIVDLTYLKNEHLGRNAKDRNAVFDIYCENEKGEKFIVEMQKAKHNFFKERSIYYSTFPIQEQAKKGNWDYQLTAVYTVGLLDFVFNDTDENQKNNYYHHKVKLMEIKKKKVFYDKLTFIYIELPKFTKTIEELNTHFEKWLYVLKHMPDLQNIPSKLQERIFKKVFREAEIAQLTPKAYQEYEDSLKRYRDLKGVIDTAKEEGLTEGLMKGKQLGLTEGKQLGLAEGKQLGLAEGKQLGLAEGKQLGLMKGKQEMVINMHKQGMNIDTIAEISNLSTQKINSILKKQNT